MLLMVWGGQRFIGKITILVGRSYHLAFGTPRRGYVRLVGDGLPMISGVVLVSGVAIFFWNIGGIPASLLYCVVIDGYTGRWIGHQIRLELTFRSRSTRFTLTTSEGEVVINFRHKCLHLKGSNQVRFGNIVTLPQTHCLRWEQVESTGGAR